MTAPHRLMAAVAHQMPAGSDFRIRQTVPGRLSGRDRVLPIALYVKFGSTTVTLVFSDDMEPAAFANLLQDTGAAGGALVGPEGWSDDDTALARDCGFTLHNTYSGALVSIPVLYRFLYINEISPSFFGGGLFPLPAELSPYRYELFDCDREPLGMVRDVLWKRWTSGTLGCSPGYHRDLELLAGQSFTRIGGEFYELRVRVDLGISEAFYLAHLQPAEALEFLNSAEAPDHVETTWTQLPNPSTLAVQPLTKTVNRLRSEQLASHARVPYVPTRPDVVDAMLNLACVGSGDVVFDLGCGDGRVVIAAARKYGVRGVGVDDDPVRIGEARANAEAAGVAKLVEFRQQSIFDAQFPDATVVCLYLLPDVNRRLRPHLQQQLAAGARVVSHSFDMGDWKPDEVYQADWKKRVFLWRVREPETQL